MAHRVEGNGEGRKHMQDSGPDDTCVTGVGMRITQCIFSYRYLKVRVLVL